MRDTLTATQPLTWLGPFSFTQDPTTNIYQVEAAQQPGLYIWTIEHHLDYLPYYVGETTRQTLISRIHQHVLDYFIGNKDIFDAARFAQGVKQPVWSKLTSRTEHLDMSPFIQEYQAISQHIAGMLRLFRLFIAPLTAEERIVRRIESALVTALAVDNAEVRQFQTTISHQAKLATEPAFTVNMTLPAGVQICGWKPSVQA